MSRLTNIKVIQNQQCTNDYEIPLCLKTVLSCLSVGGYRLVDRWSMSYIFSQPFEQESFLSVKVQWQHRQQENSVIIRRIETERNMTKL